MSRIGRAPVQIPKEVKINFDRQSIVVEGPKGKLDWNLPEGISVKLNDSVLTVNRKNDLKRHRELHGLSRTLIANMVVGVTTGFSKKLRVVGAGYRASIDKQKRLILNVGFSHPVTFTPPEGISIEVGKVEAVEGQPHVPIIVSGIDKELVGQTSASIRAIKKPRAYKPSKGIRYDGEKVRMKEGKTKA